MTDTKKSAVVCLFAGPYLKGEGSSSNLQFANKDSPHINEILPSLNSRSEICHLTLVDETDFVKMVVKLLASLVDGDNGS